ncbi:hypothetical protein Ae168Ps1_6383 [Pseudonocardia sp. Ae168_Ps1]|uniref:hypothetical protein n=1 Tax=unclassified Pseudonocardia TaxID=2619320 RepID=UPI00095E89EA|nr:MULTISPECIES: hypothetical protein [unclassified Pseudonocardia]OLL69826.1 hypothetical protein Ae150APs1_6237 [Pseudonocardia sp. Ae150A_Ps1]OLL69958.1 hypothetical protein Ae168Ps1_6383 [Pseudonocardia sp. Ae168_Ps1]OLL89119.1 hypothetical protein Ae356Ps1_6236 [Pseudonocardia sp. Ae356_Ps1]
MSKADEIHAKAKATHDLRTASRAAAAAARAQVRAAPVRRTVDLAPQTHARLAGWCAETAEELGVARVTGQAVLAALVTRLLDDTRLAREIRNDLHH